MGGMKTVVALAPLIILQLALQIVALIDLYKRPNVTGGNKIVWLLIILLFAVLGSLAYLIFGRRETE